MRFVKQPDSVSCFAACIASLTGLPFAAVPPFRNTYEGAQLDACQKWLKRFGWTLFAIKVKHGRRLPWSPMTIGPVCIIGLTLSKNNRHVVIGRIDEFGIHVLFDPSEIPWDIKPKHVTEIYLLVPAFHSKPIPDVITRSFVDPCAAAKS